MRARSVSLGVLALLEGPLLAGRGLGQGYLDFGLFVLALTPPGAARMPNGIECDLVVPPGGRAWLGRGRLESGGRCVLPGPLWDPVPDPCFHLEIDRRFTPEPLLLAGRGCGLTPSGDDLLAGYAAGLHLFHGNTAAASALVELAVPRTTALSATLLRHAARGELPEPAHALLERGDPEPLRRFGHSSGRALLVGLALAC